MPRKMTLARRPPDHPGRDIEFGGSREVISRQGWGSTEQALLSPRCAAADEQPIQRTVSGRVRRTLPDTVSVQAASLRAFWGHGLIPTAREVESWRRHVHIGTPEAKAGCRSGRESVGRTPRRLSGQGYLCVRAGAHRINHKRALDLLAKASAGLRASLWRGRCGRPRCGWRRRVCRWLRRDSCAPCPATDADARRSPHFSPPRPPAAAPGAPAR